MKKEYTREEAIRFIETILQKLSEKAEEAREKNIDDLQEDEAELYLRTAGAGFTESLKKAKLGSTLGEYDNHTISVLLGKCILAAAEFELEQELHEDFIIVEKEENMSASSELKIIVGISDSKSILGKIIGDHVFIMCIHKQNQRKSIMLDASGHYGNGRSSDVVDGVQIPINVQAYLNYFNTDERLITFEFYLPDSEAKKVKKSIETVFGRSSFQCAFIASTVLRNSGVFNNEIQIQLTPRGLLHNLNRYAKDNPCRVNIKAFSFRTKEELPYEN